MPEQDTVARIEARYRAQSDAIEEWSARQHQAIEAESALRHGQARADRDRDFQAHGLKKDGSVRADEAAAKLVGS